MGQRGNKGRQGRSGDREDNNITEPWSSYPIYHMLGRQCHGHHSLRTAALFSSVLGVHTLSVCAMVCLHTSIHRSQYSSGERSLAIPRGNVLARDWTGSDAPLIGALRGEEWRGARGA